MGKLNCNVKEASDSGFGEAYYMAHLSNLKMKKGFKVKISAKVRKADLRSGITLSSVLLRLLFW